MMSKKNRSRRGRTRRSRLNNVGASGNLVTRVSFSETWSQTWTSQSDMRTFGLTSANSGIVRLNDLGQYWQFYRFVEVKATVLPTSVGVFAFCYNSAIAGVSDITTFAEATEVQPTVLITPNQTVPVRMKLGRRVLLETPAKWFPYNASATAYQPTQGNFHLVPSASISSTVFVQFTGVLEFIRPTSGAGLDKQIVTRHVSGCRCAECATSEEVLRHKSSK